MTPKEPHPLLQLVLAPSSKSSSPAEGCAHKLTHFRGAALEIVQDLLEVISLPQRVVIRIVLQVGSVLESSLDGSLDKSDRLAAIDVRQLLATGVVEFLVRACSGSAQRQTLG